MQITLCFSALTLSALLAPLSNASFVSGNTWGCLGTPDPNSPNQACSIGGFNQNVLGGPAQVDATYGSLAVNQATMTITAAGGGTYGSLNAGATTSFDVTGPPTPAFVRGAGSFSDQITISYAPWNGEAGLLYFSYSLDGTISSTGTGQAFADVIVQAGPIANSAAQSWTQTYTASTSGIFSLPAPINIVYGQPFDLDVDLGAFAGSATLQPGGLFSIGSASGVGAGSAEFLDTLVLTGLVPTDLNGNPATGAQFTSASGTPYSTSGVVPEPATVMLSLLGISAGIVWKVRGFQIRSS